MFPHVAGEQQVPSARHTCDALHVRHVIVPPHPFVTGRHDGVVSFAQLVGVQHAFASHTAPVTGHVPHVRVPPHPSLIVPQLLAPHVRGVQVAVQLPFTQ